MLRRRSEMPCDAVERCHDGEGALSCRKVLGGGDSDVGIAFMHDDVLEPGARIGEHRHDGNEEIYFVVEGCGTMLLDGESFPIGPGDVSLVQSGHTHGIVNSPDGEMRLLVLCVDPDRR